MNHLEDLDLPTLGIDAAQFAAIQEVLSNLTPGAQRLFWTVPRGSLARMPALVDGAQTENGVPRTPLEALADGDYDAVLRAAHGCVGR